LAGYEFGSKNATHAVATLGLFLATSTRIAPAALRLQQGVLSIKNSIGGSESTFTLINKLKEVEPIDSVIDALDFTHDGFVPEIKLEKVTFNYPSSDKFSLGNINISIKQGSITAIVGPSGAGKTTLVDLILGVLSPSSGEIFISGVKPSEASRQWAGAISYVPQNVTIASGSIAENVTLGYRRLGVPQESIWDALTVAQLSAVVRDLDNGIETMVGENGTKLSGGQRQRLGIARAMFTKPKLLVLDEATSSLDGKTEADVSEAILELSGQVTILIVAHRLSTIKNADQIVYLEKGSIRAVGTLDHVKEQIPEFANEILRSGL
jgi:ABC-type multidrug transport system fused ATPase/permease subunit